MLVFKGAFTMSIDSIPHIDDPSSKEVNVIDINNVICMKMNIYCCSNLMKAVPVEWQQLLQNHAVQLNLWKMEQSKKWHQVWALCLQLFLNQLKICRQQLIVSCDVDYDYFESPFIKGLQDETKAFLSKWLEELRSVNYYQLYNNILSWLY